MLYEDSNTLTLEHLLRWRARFYFEMRRNVMVFTFFSIVAVVLVALRL